MSRDKKYTKEDQITYYMEKHDQKSIKKNIIPLSDILEEDYEKEGISYAEAVRRVRTSHTGTPLEQAWKELYNEEEYCKKLMEKDIIHQIHNIKKAKKLQEEEDSKKKPIEIISEDFRNSYSKEVCRQMEIIIQKARLMKKFNLVDDDITIAELIKTLEINDE